MKTLTTFCFSILTLGFCNAQNLVYMPKMVYTSHTLADNELKGNVVSATIMVPSSDTIEHPTDADFVPSYMLFFDEQGRMTHQRSYPLYATEEGEETEYTETTYTYDAKGNLVQIREARDFGYAELFYKYDEQGRIIELMHHLGDEAGSKVKTTYSYSERKNELFTQLSNKSSQKGEAFLDEQGRITKMVTYNCVNKRCDRVFEVAYQYTADGKLASEKGSVAQDYSIVYEYDDKGQLIKRVSEYKDVEGFATTETFEYDANGCLLQTASAISTSPIPTTPTRYECDAHGNWIKIFSGDFYTTQRQIIYR